MPATLYWRQQTLHSKQRRLVYPIRKQASGPCHLQTLPFADASSCWVRPLLRAVQFELVAGMPCRDLADLLVSQHRIFLLSEPEWRKMLLSHVVCTQLSHEELIQLESIPSCTMAVAPVSPACTPCTRAQHERLTLDACLVAAQVPEGCLQRRVNTRGHAHCVLQRAGVPHRPGAGARPASNGRGFHAPKRPLALQPVPMAVSHRPCEIAVYMRIRVSVVA